MKESKAPAILVPFDGSRTALRAVTYAITQAKPIGSVVHVLNVYEPLDPRIAAYLSRQRYRAISTKHGKVIVAPAVDRLRRADIPYAVHITYGNIAETIVRMARALKCDSIIMGTRGMTALGNLILGSVSNKVIHLATTPLTLVK